MNKKLMFNLSEVNREMLIIFKEKRKDICSQ